jgi:hypothetical protein
MGKDMQVMIISVALIIRRQIIQVNNTIINNTRINSVFPVLTTVNLLLPTPVYVG